jgi:Rad3-related DNA helicase/DNA-binding NarL/FixJ family response regulator
LTICGPGEEYEEISVLIADASPLFRSGIRLSIEGHEGFGIVGEAETLERAVGLAREIQPKVVILGLSGYHRKTWEAISCLAEHSAVLAITQVDGTRETLKHVLKVFLSGAVGCVDRLAAGEELSYVLKAVVSGRPAVSSGVAKALVDELLRLQGFAVSMGEHATYAGGSKNSDQGLSDGEQADAQASVPRRWDGKEKLTDREMEVLALVANGESNRGIAGQLLISEKTVKNHISSILRKLGMSGYEFRGSQLEMAFGVLRSFFTSRHALVESGTGTGKSIAYLVPAILWASNTGNKVVISTNTINLQEQLIHKDLPSLINSLDMEFRYCLVKGRSNYVCLRKLAMLSSEMEDEVDDDLRLAFTEFISELSQVTTGSRSDFHLEAPAEIWDRVSSDSMSCLRTRCPWGKKCYFVKARSEMEDADILVTNHHLLFSDLALRMTMPDSLGSRVLPEYEYLILDEAHNLADVAEEHLGYGASLLNMQRAHNELVNVEGPRRSRGGLLFNLRAMVFTAKPDAKDSLVQKIVSCIDTSIEATRRSYEASASFFQSLGEFLKYASAKYRGGNHAVRLKEDITELAKWQDVILPGAENAIIRGQELARNLNQILGLLDMLEEDSDNGLKSLQGDIQGVVGRLSSETNALSFAVSMEDSEFVYWGTSTPSNIQLNATPLNVAPYLRRHLFGMTESVILTSATMTVGGDFHFFKRLVGLDEQPDPALEFIFDSPFDFKYVENGAHHEVWFESPHSLKPKLELVEKYDIGGIAIWKLGYEDSHYWKAIADGLAK